MPAEEEALLKSLAVKRSQTGARLWQSLEGEQWKSVADALREFGVKAPIAGCSHWRRESDFNAAQATAGLDLVDDRLFWSIPTFGDADRRSMVWSPSNAAGSLKSEANRKRKADRPYVVGEWCSRIGDAWALPFESADLLVVSLLAATEDWDGVARRGVFMYPTCLGRPTRPARGGDEEDVLHQIPEAVNGIPQFFAVLPHAASIFFQGKSPRPAAAAARKREMVWLPAQGRLVIDTPHTFAVVDSSGQPAKSSDGLVIRSDSNFAVVAASSLGPDPIAVSKRLLVTYLGRAEPTDLRWADDERRDPGDPSIRPMRREPGRRPADLETHRNRSRLIVSTAPANASGQASVEKTSEGWKVLLDGEGSTVHWEVVVE